MSKAYEVLAFPKLPITGKGREYCHKINGIQRVKGQWMTE